MELKPCPFCGGKTIKELKDYNRDNRKTKYYCQCNTCGAIGPTVKTIVHDFDADNVEAHINAENMSFDGWNRREAETNGK